MGGMATDRRSRVAALLRYGIGSPRRATRSGGLRPTVRAGRQARGLAGRSSGALEGASRDVDRGMTATAGEVSRAGRWGHRYADRLRGTRLAYRCGPGAGQAAPDASAHTGGLGRRTSPWATRRPPRAPAGRPPGATGLYDVYRPSLDHRRALYHLAYLTCDMLPLCGTGTTRGTHGITLGECLRRMTPSRGWRGHSLTPKISRLLSESQNPRAIQSGLLASQYSSTG